MCLGELWPASILTHFAAVTAGICTLGGQWVIGDRLESEPTPGDATWCMGLQHHSCLARLPLCHDKGAAGPNLSERHCDMAHGDATLCDPVHHIATPRARSQSRWVLGGLVSEPNVKIHVIHLLSKGATYTPTNLLGKGSFSLPPLLL